MQFEWKSICLTKTIKKKKTKKRKTHPVLFRKIISDSLLACIRGEILLARFARISCNRSSQAFQNDGKGFNKKNADITKK